MKKLLAILLTLILCLGMLASCDDSSVSSEDEKLKVEITDSGKPVFCTISDTYTKYQIKNLKSESSVFENYTLLASRYLFVSYLEFITFAQNISDDTTFDISEESFENHVVLVVLRNPCVSGVNYGDLVQKNTLEGSHIGKPYKDEPDNKYILSVEYTFHYPQYSTGISGFPSVDAVLIPKEKINVLPEDLEIEIKAIEHTYMSSTNMIE